MVALTVPDRSFFDRCMDRLFRHAEAADLTLSCRPVNALSDPADVIASLQSDDDVIGYIVFQNTLTSPDAVGKAPMVTVEYSGIVNVGPASTSGIGRMFRITVSLSKQPGL